jgi:hypothetical protein
MLSLLGLLSIFREDVVHRVDPMNCEEHSYYFVIGLNPHCGLIMSLLLFLLLD